MALFKINRGASYDLPNTLNDGWAYFCTDDFSFHIDYTDENGVLRRAQLNAADAETLTGAALSTVLNSSATHMEIPTSKAVLTALSSYQTKLTFDSAPKASSSNPVTSSGVKTYVDNSVSTHNSSSSAHSDIRTLISELNTELDGHTHTVEDITNLQAELDGKAAVSHGTHVTFSTTKPVVDGTASVGSATTVARSDHKHPTDTTRASKTDFDAHTTDTVAHVASTERTQWGAAYTHSQATHAPSDAQKNQNAFSNVKVGSTTVAADSPTDTLELVGSNVTITPDATNDKITIAVASGSTSTAGILKLTNSTSSTSTTTAATPNSVKSAYDAATAAKTQADIAYDLADSKAATLSDLGVTATAAELNYVSGVTSSVQTQLDGKSSSGHNHDSAYDSKGSANSALTTAKAYTDTKTSGLASTSTVDSKISTHNSSTSAHNDIRTLINDLKTKVNNFLDVDDATTDQLSEVLTLINNNKGTLESLTTSKINVSDIVDNLTTSNAGKVLSAKQGVALKALIDALDAELDSHTHAIADVSGLQSALDGKAASSHGTHVSFTTTKPVMDGTAAVGSASTVSRSDHKHPTDTSRAAKTDFDTHVADTTKHITSTERTNWGTAYTHSQATHAPTNAQKNQNAFSNIAVSGQTTVAADSETDTVTFVGSNVSITTDATNDTVTFSVASGSTSKAGILKLTDSTSSTSTTTAATPKNVKSAYDLANSAQTKADSAYTLAEGKVGSLSELGVTVAAAKINYLSTVTSDVQTQLDGKSATDHTHKYAGSSSVGGAATSAAKLNTDAGSTTQPVYFSGGIPVKTTYTLGKSVPSDAKFTDTTYGRATTTADGLMSLEDKAKVNYTNVAYGTCSTAADTAAKVITLSGNTQWALAAGAMVTVLFSATNTADNPTFNVNGTGAKNVFVKNTQITTSALSYAGTANVPMTFMYDGTQYIFVSKGLDSDDTSKTNSTNTSKKIFLIGATSQGSGKTTYSHDTAYVGTDGCLYSNSTKVSVEGHKHTVADISDLTATATELNYVDGVTSNIQTQFNSISSEIINLNNRIDELISSAIAVHSGTESIPPSNMGEDGDLYIYTGS